MRVSIIIVTWNALPLLKKCLPSVVASDYPGVEIILADNASTDGSAEWVEKTFPGVRVVRHPENWAFCRGNNAAVPHATGDILVFLNNDVEVPPGWLQPLVRAFADPDIAAVQPKLLQYDDRSRFEYAGASGGFIDWLGYPFTRGRVFFDAEVDSGQYNDARDIFWATGAAMAVRRSAWEEAGGFDEQFFMHMEEIDLSWRLQRMGYRIRVVPDSIVFHIGGGSLPQGNPRKTYYNFRNSLLTLYKNLPPREWRRTFPLRAALDAAAILRSLVSAGPRDAFAIIRAYADAHRMKSAYANERAAEGIPLPYRRSIVIDYFLRKWKTFQSLPEAAFVTPARPAREDRRKTASDTPSSTNPIPTIASQKGTSPNKR